ncbi:MAG: asparaginase [Calditrichaeota bacterium]|nr:asparaginase [Calditrichota bacterium]
MNQRKNILIILTGGTFGMQPVDGKALQLSTLEGKLSDMVPELNDIANTTIKSAFLIDSSDIQPDHWVQLAEIIAKELDNYDGFVIIHGTDTMAFTASALSFMLSGLSKPVILTGSQKPLREVRNDARSNLINAVIMATYQIPEVCICFNNKLYRGNRAKKVSINDFDAYVSPNFEALAEIGIQINLSDQIIEPRGMFQLRKQFDTAVTSIPLFPGIKASDLLFLSKSAIKAVIFEGYGAGNLPSKENNFIPIVEELVRQDKIVVIKSQCIRGAVDLTLYEGGRKALDAGAIGSSDITRDAAIVKLMFLLGNLENQSQVKEYFLKPLAGEMNEQRMEL